MTKKFKHIPIVLSMASAYKENVKKIRNDKGFTRAQVAELMNVDEGKVKRLEWGKSKIDLESLEHFAKAMGLSLIDVITYPVKYSETQNNSADYEASISIRIPNDKLEEILKIAQLEKR